MGLQETLSKKVGPLPLGVWLLAVGGGLGLSFLIQRDTGEPEDTEDEEGTEFDEFGFEPFTYSGAVGLPDYGTQEPPKPAPRMPETNDEWLSVGVNYLISLGKNGLAAQDALARYLDGHPVTQEQAELVNLVIVELGSPPEGAPVLQPPDEDGETPTPEDPEPEEPSTENRIRWHSATPNDIQEKYSAPAAAQILVSLGVGYQPAGSAPVVDVNDVKAGLRKLGWTKSSDLAYNVTNVSRLMRLQANPSGSGEYGSKKAVWGGAVPEFVKRQYSAESLQQGLQRLGIKPGRVISVADFQAGLKKLGYKKAENLNLDASAYNRVVQGIKAKKGQ